MVALVWYLATTCRTFKNLPPLTMLCPCRFRLTTRTPVVSVDKPALTPCKFYHDDIAKKKSVSSLSSIFSLFDLIFRDFMSALQNMWWLLETNFYVFADFHFHAFSSPSYCFLPIFLFTIFCLLKCVLWLHKLRWYVILSNGDNFYSSAWNRVPFSFPNSLLYILWIPVLIRLYISRIIKNQEGDEYML